MPKRLLFLPLVLLTLLSLSACEKNGGEKLSEGDVHLAKGDYDRALSVYRQNAKKGDAYALFGLCRMYGDGLGVVENGRLAFQYCMQSAKRGEVKAQKRLAVMYYKGLGVTRNERQARFWFRQAALSDDPDALYYLGIANLKGIGGGKDPHHAHDLFEKAARKGHVKARWTLYEMFDQGIGIRQHKPEAFRWLMTLADEGDARAGYRVGMSYLSGNGVAANPAEAVEWIGKAAEKGYEPALVTMVLYYLQNTPAQIGEARSWAARLENQTRSRGTGVLFRRFFEDLDEWPETERTHERIKRWFDTAFATNDPDMLYGLGFLCELGYPGRRDMKKAIALYKKAAASGNESAVLKLKELQAAF